MAFNGEWKVLGIEHVISNGWIRNITAVYEGTDNNAFDRKIAFAEYADSGTPTYTFDDLTENDVLNMVFTYIGSTEKSAIETNVENRVADIKDELENPVTASNLPWE
jgi:hypothetical protein